MDFSGITLDIVDSWHVEPLDGWRNHARYTSSDGTVDLACYALMPGIMLMDIDLSCTWLPVSKFTEPTPATINWCRSGRCEVELDSQGSIVVGEQTLCLSSARARDFSYPTGTYRGFEYVIDLARMPIETSAVLEAFDLDAKVIGALFSQGEAAINVHAFGELATCVQSIERTLATAAPKRAQLLIDTVRLLALLAEGDFEGTPPAAFYLRRSQREMARAVFEHIQASPSPSAHLEPLAVELGVSASSLRAYFEKVYGDTPAAFARKRALAHAASLLAEGDMPIGDIALACGYSNPSKFSAAFRRAYGMAPLEYRRRRRVHCK